MQTIEKSSKSGRMTNYMEVLADGILEGILPEYKGVRFTEGQKQDIKACALNRLWPMYVTTPTGKDFIKKVVAEDKIEKDVARELRAAIDKVRQHPR